MKDIFSPQVNDELIQRINKLTPETPAQWGKMNVGQMLAHCNVTYEGVYEEDKHPKPNGFVKFMLKLFIKKVIVSEKPYKPNGKTAPHFIITDERVFDKEKERLIAFMNKTQALGRSHFDQKESHSIGKLSAQEWNNLFYKHLDHHLKQFGV